MLIDVISEYWADSEMLVRLWMIITQWLKFMSKHLTFIMLKQLYICCVVTFLPNQWVRYLKTGSGGHEFAFYTVCLGLKCFNIFLILCQCWFLQSDLKLSVIVNPDLFHDTFISLCTSYFRPYAGKISWEWLDFLLPQTVLEFVIPV